MAGGIDGMVVVSATIPGGLLEHVAGLFVAAATTIDMPYCAWVRFGDTAAVREAIDPAERALLRELMRWRVGGSAETGRRTGCSSATALVGR